MYLLHVKPRHKEPVKVDFYIAKDEGSAKDLGSVLLSWESFNYNF